MLPFDRYPARGRQLLGRAKGTNCRHEYGLEFMRVTGETRCGYCDVDFAATYETWLTMVLDHAIPANVCTMLSVPKEWWEDLSNTVLACAACNGFCNRYRPNSGVSQPLTLEVFYDLRDQIFTERKKLIAASHKAEREFFETKPWESRKTQGLARAALP